MNLIVKADLKHEGQIFIVYVGDVHDSRNCASRYKATLI